MSGSTYGSNEMDMIINTDGAIQPIQDDIRVISGLEAKETLLDEPLFSNNDE